MASTRKDHLVETALKLFYEQGYHATGIDKILAAAKVAKMTLYNHFKSKDELILATLYLRDRRFRDWLREEVEMRAESPSERLLATFDVMADWVRRPEFHGCMFMKAAAEFGDPSDPIHQAAAEHKRQVYDFLLELAEESGTHRPRELAAQLMLLIEGAVVTSQIDPQAPAARQAKKAAQTLITTAIEGETRH